MQLFSLICFTAGKKKSILHLDKFKFTIVGAHAGEKCEKFRFISVYTTLSEPISLQVI